MRSDSVENCKKIKIVSGHGGIDENSQVFGLSSSERYELEILLEELAALIEAEDGVLIP